MIKKIDIQKFGLFSDYNWNSEVGSDPDKDVFKKVNIIYGRNYSGKTTLSRIFRCVENGKLHEDWCSDLCSDKKLCGKKLTTLSL